MPVRFTTDDGDAYTSDDGEFVLFSEYEALALKLQQSELDAARYRWLRDGHAYAPEEEGIRGGAELDALCDDGLARGR